MSPDAFWALVNAAVAVASVALQLSVCYFAYRKFKR